jgi:hypothetical protein
MLADEMRNSLPLGRGRHHFFPRRSFNATLSSMASASMRLSLPAILVLQGPQPLGLGHLHPTELCFPLVDAGVADPVLAAQLRNRNASLMLLQNPDDLLFGKATAFHALVLKLGQNEFQTGLGQRGNVKATHRVREANR